MFGISSAELDQVPYNKHQYEHGSSLPTCRSGSLSVCTAPRGRELTEKHLGRPRSRQKLQLPGFSPHATSTASLAIGNPLTCTASNNNISSTAMSSPCATVSRILPRAEAAYARRGGLRNGSGSRPAARRWMSSSHSTAKRPKTAIFFPGTCTIFASTAESGC